MEFEWSEDQLDLRAQAVAFGRGALDDGVQEDDREGRFPAEKWKRLAEWGYFGLCVPSELGGAGVDVLSGLLVTEGLGEGCGDCGLLFSAAVQAWVVIRSLLAFGTDEQQRHYLPGLLDGSTIGALAITEPDSGSDAFAMRTRAEQVEGGWRLRGQKALITNGPVADLVVCFALSGPGGALGGSTVFLVETATAGVERGPAQSKMGLRTSPLGDIYLDDAQVPASAVLGKPGGGLIIFNEALEWERIWPMALHIGIMERELDQTRAYARRRKAFGAPIARHQAIEYRIVDMKLRLEAGRLLLYRAAWLKQHAKASSADAAMAKLWLSESALANSLDALHVHGGYGFMTEFGVERAVRDAVGSRLYSGTSEMQRAIVARGLGL
jgi:alkylation response protein AidB-like acyl-CoA dehydrogenase